MRTPAAVYREFRDTGDEWGLWREWVPWNPQTDRLVREFVDGSGRPFIEVEYRWTTSERKWLFGPRQTVEHSELETYGPSEVRYHLEETSETNHAPL